VGGLGNESLSGMLTQLGGIQTYVTTMIVGYVLLMFLRMALRTPSRI
jgi:exfoliative toxin A/B